MNLESIDTICVGGWAKTGVSLTELLLLLGKKVKVTEGRSRANFDPALIKKFQEKGVKFEFGKHSEEFIKKTGLIVVSPGIDLAASKLGEIIRKNKVPYTGELELAAASTKAKIIAITGTNGKTSTAYLTYLLLKAAGKGVYLGGNIGRPFSEIVPLASEKDFIVLEVSSFQLETIIKFRPHVAVLLNVTPDHLNRHKTFENYLKIKVNIFKNQQRDDWSLVYKNNPLLGSYLTQLNSQLVYFGGEFPNDNLSAAYRIGRIFNISRNQCLKVFSQYRNLPHRQQEIRTINKVNFINDSKATNPDSAIWALKFLRSPVILIAGGRDKGFSYLPLEAYSRKLKKINLIGEAADKIKAELGSKINCEKFNSLEEAVLASYREAKKGTTVLFSPMCASFDMFSTYKERGRKFISIVENLS